MDQRLQAGVERCHVLGTRTAGSAERRMQLVEFSSDVRQNVRGWDERDIGWVG
jgi:hypothetical protein